MRISNTIAAILLCLTFAAAASAQTADAAIVARDEATEGGGASIGNTAAVM